MRRVRIKIWEREAKQWVEIEGKFHQWGCNYEEFESGPGNYSVAIVELPGGRVVMPTVDNVVFLDKEAS